MGQSLWRRFASTQVLAELGQFYTQMQSQATDDIAKASFKENADLIQTFIEAIKKAETNPQLVSEYSKL